ncbi:MAG TPA: long-chain-acyl-CoA synthetase [Steroidobacteraceae bacterium]|nr:long-chain-acyl-CoA synthetase [Steroidobacteraceae bacterium]
MKPAKGEHTRSASQAWMRALQATAAIGAGSCATLPEQLAELGARHGQAPALLSGERQLSYAQLADSIQRHARWGLAQGLRPGDVVALLMPNCPEYLAIWLGLSRIGVRVALVNTQLRGAVLAHSINTVAPRALLVGAALAEAAHSARALVPEAVQWWGYGGGHGAQATALPRADLAIGAAPAEPLTAAECPSPSLSEPALYIYTSGTTGLPKAAIVSHRRVLQWSHWFAGMMDVQAADRMYDCLPMYHSIGGVVATGSVLVRGGAVVLRERFSAREFWQDLARERCTLFQYIGELCRYLLAQPPDPLETRHALRLCCGNGLHESVWEGFRERFRIPQILEYYAATEGSFSLYNCEGRPGAIGRVPPFLAHRMRVALVRVDPESAAPRRDASGHCEPVAAGEAGEALGEIGEAGEVRAADAGARFEGYADAQATRQKILRDVFASGDRWYRSGDLMRQDAQGFFYFVERLGDTFRWKGENVSTTEVATVLMACPGVREAAVYGVAVPGAEGRAGMAALVVEPSFDPAAFRAEIARALPEYARPLFLRLVPALALTGTFKLSKQQLLAEAYDPAIVSDPLYFDDRARGAFVRLDAALHRRLQLGSCAV